MDNTKLSTEFQNSMLITSIILGLDTTMDLKSTIWRVDM